jgi:hypothetical protein
MGVGAIAVKCSILFSQHTDTMYIVHPGINITSNTIGVGLTHPFNRFTEKCEIANF